MKIIHPGLSSRPLNIPSNSIFDDKKSLYVSCSKCSASLLMFIAAGVFRFARVAKTPLHERYVSEGAAFDDIM